MLEAQLHASSAFLTLTYDEKHVPEELKPEDLRNFLKRLRRRLPYKVRFYAVGEYGDANWRPHYHVIVFGLGGLVIGRHDHPDGKKIQRKCDCVVCQSWPDGLVHVGEVTPDSAGYTVSYTLKRMTKEEDPRLKGKHPEFARMSLRPGGLGSGALGYVMDTLTGEACSRSIARAGDVPGRFRSAGKQWPLGRYLLGKLRADYGVDAERVNELLAVSARALQQELREPGARAFREQKRIQAARKAYARFQILRSKKGQGI